MWTLCAGFLWWMIFYAQKLHIHSHFITSARFDWKLIINLHALEYIYISANQPEHWKLLSIYFGIRFTFSVCVDLYKKKIESKCVYMVCDGASGFQFGYYVCWYNMYVYLWYVYVHAISIFSMPHFKLSTFGFTP